MKIEWKAIVCVVSLLVWSSFVKGQMLPDDCIREAWKNNYRLKNAQLSVSEARLGTTDAIGSFLPRVSAQTEIGRTRGRSLDAEINEYIPDSYTKGMVGLDVSISLFEGFSKINRLRFARYQQKEKEMELSEKKNELAYQVTEAYFRLVLMEKMVELAQEQQRLGERYLVQTIAFVDLGLKSMSDLQEVKARCQGDVSRYISYVKSRDMSKIFLKELMGMNESDSLMVATENAEVSSSVSSTDCENLYEQSLQVLPEYRRMKMQVLAAQKDYSVAVGQFYPKVYARFSMQSDFFDSFNSGSRLRNGLSSYIGVGISFPILSGLNRYTDMKRKRYNIEEVRNNSEQEKLRLRREMEEVTLSFRVGREEYRQSIVQTKADSLVLKESERKWEEGLISVFQLMEARTRLLTAKAEEVRTQLQYELTSRLVRYYQIGTFIADEL